LESDISIENNIRPSAPSRAARIFASPLVRILLGIVIVVAPVILTLWLAHVLLEKSQRVMWPQIMAAALCVASYWYFVRQVEKRRVTELSGASALRDLAFGVLGGSVLVATAMGVLFIAGSFQISGINGWTGLIVPIAELILVAFVEELLFRGIMFGIVEQSLGSWIALGLTSSIFALSHLPNEGVTVLAVVVTAMAGVMFGAAFMATGRLWLGIGIHFGWNYVLGTVFAVTVSGHRSSGLLQGTLVGPDWLTGGAYGLEASVVGLAAVSIASAFLIALARKRGRIVPLRRKRKNEAAVKSAT
jgi:membrane protease YdiL (CAAX protease family)